MILPAAHMPLPPTHSLLAADSARTQTTGNAQPVSVPNRNTAAAANWHSGPSQNFSDALASALQMKSDSAAGQLAGVAQHVEADTQGAVDAEPKTQGVPPSASAEELIAQTWAAAKPTADLSQAPAAPAKPDLKAGNEPEPTDARPSRPSTPKADSQPQGSSSAEPIRHEPQPAVAQPAVTTTVQELPSPSGGATTRIGNSHQDPAATLSPGLPLRSNEPRLASNDREEPISHGSDISAFRLDLDIAAPVAPPAASGLTAVQAKSLATPPTQTDEQGGPAAPQGDTVPPAGLLSNAPGTQPAVTDRQSRNGPETGSNIPSDSVADRQSGRAPTPGRASAQDTIGQTNASSPEFGAPALAAKTPVGSSTRLSEAPAVIGHSAAPNAPKEIVVRVEGVRGEVINVRVADQGGRVQVAVRSNDTATASLLRQDLPSLTNTLERMGWKAEFSAGSTPQSPVAQHALRTDTGEPQRDRDGSPLTWNQDPERKKHSTPELWDAALDAQDPATLLQSFPSRYQ